MSKMRLNVQVGDVIGNGFVVVSTERRHQDRPNGQRQYLVHVRCPVCKRHVHRMAVNLRRMLSCGCQQVQNSRMTRTLTRWAPLVREANAAFGLDPRYTIEFARQAHKIRVRAAGQDSSLVK